jgi:RNA polymerase sigma factor (sigma-70 family)
MTIHEVEKVFRSLRSRLRGFLYVQYHGLSSEEHDDIIQDTFELLLKNPDKWTDTSRDCFPLMCEMVKRRANGRIRHYRMRAGKSEKIYHTQANHVLPDPATRILDELDAGLTERQTEIFVMKMQGYEYKDIMARLGIAKSTVNTTLDVVRKKLRSKVLLHRRQDHPILRYRTQ